MRKGFTVWSWLTWVSEMLRLLAGPLYARKFISGVCKRGLILKKSCFSKYEGVVHVAVLLTRV